MIRRSNPPLPAGGSQFNHREKIIVGIESGRPDLGADVQVVDVTGRTILPGIVDAHVHLAAWAQWLISNQHQSLMYLAARTVYAMQATLNAGITTVRDLGGLESGFVRAQEAGLLVGPRMQSSVVIIQSINGVTDNIPGQGGTTSPQGMRTTVPGMPLPYVNGPWEARQKVREALRAGADVIKIATTGFAVRGVPQRELPDSRSRRSRRWWRRRTTLESW